MCVQRITEKLKIPCDHGKIGYWVGGEWGRGATRSGAFHGLLKKWWDHFGLKGVGLVIGEELKPQAIKCKNILKATYPEIEEVFTVGLETADIIWDITTPLKTKRLYDWIICQAVLEHVKDPVATVKNMGAVLKPNGMLYLHTHGPRFGYHACPIDCWRFYRDAFIAMAELAKLEIADIFIDSDLTQCFVAYRKP